jgi:hypothetical protein
VRGLKGFEVSKYPGIAHDLRKPDLDRLRRSGGGSQAAGAGQQIVAPQRRSVAF